MIGGVAVEFGRGGKGGVDVEELERGPEVLTALEGGPLGGGGVAFAAGVASGSFLLIHLFCSES